MYKPQIEATFGANTQRYKRKNTQCKYAKARKVVIYEIFCTWPSCVKLYGTGMVTFTRDSVYMDKYNNCLQY